MVMEWRWIISVGTIKISFIFFYFWNPTKKSNQQLYMEHQRSNRTVVEHCEPFWTKKYETHIYNKYARVLTSYYPKLQVLHLPSSTIVLSFYLIRVIFIFQFLQRHSISPCLTHLRIEMKTRFQQSVDFGEGRDFEIRFVIHVSVSRRVVPPIFVKKARKRPCFLPTTYLQNIPTLNQTTLSYTLLK